MAFNTRAGGLRHPRDWPYNGAEMAFVMRGFHLNGKEFAFTYDALITDYDLEEFTNKVIFDFYEDGNPDRIEENAVVTNVDQGGEIVGKTRAWLNINKVINGTTTPIPNVTFEIVRGDGGPLYQGREEVKVTLTTDENGQIRAQGFRPGKLILKEIDAPEWIEFDPSKSIELDLDAGNKNDIHTVENDVKTIDLTVTKLWEDKKDQDGLRPESITIKLLADGEETGQELILSESNNWTGSFTALDMCEDGALIAYTIEEVKVEGYEVEVSGDVDSGYLVTNTHEVEKTDLAVTKLWEDKNDQDGLRPESVIIKLLADGEETGQELILSESNNWTGSFTALDVYKAGELIAYTIEEVEVEGYEGVVSGDVDSGYLVTNTHEVEETSPKEEPEKPDDTVPKTGEGLNTIFLGTAMLLLGSVLAVLGIRKKREDY